MNKFFTCISISLLISIGAWAQTAKITGTVRDADTKDQLGGATVKVDKTKGAVSDVSGQFILNIPVGEHELTISYIGYKNDKRVVNLKEGETLKLEVLLHSSVFQMNQVVTVSQYRKNAAKETVSTDVIGKEQIKHTNSNELGEVVNKTPGVVVQDGQITIRGGSSYSYGVGTRTGLLVDGLGMTSADLGQSQNTLVPLENVKQVEVIKGASSVIYGSSALNGVVNVITEWPSDDDPKTEIETNAGVSDQPKDKRMKWWDAAPPFFGSININHQRRIKNVQLIAGGNISYNSSYLQGANEWRVRGFLKLRYLDPKKPGLNYGANASVQIERTDQFFISKDLDSLALVPANSSSSDYNKITLDPHLNYSTAKGHNYKLNIRYMNIFRKGNGSDIDAISHSLEITNQYQYRFRKDLLIITAGVPFSMGHSQSNLYHEKHFNFNWALYTQAEFNYKILSLQAGIRYEIAGLDTQIVTTRPVFRAGMNIQASKSTNVRFSWGQGYRIPSIAEKSVAQPFFKGVVIVPNDTLKDETGWNLELGIQQGFQIKDWKLGVDVALFWQEYKQFIEYTVSIWDNKYSNGQQIFVDSLEYDHKNFPGKLLGPKPLNIENARIAGYEIGLMSNGKLGPVGLQIHAGYTYNFPTRKDNDTGSTHYSTRQYLHDFFAFNGKRVANTDTSIPLLSSRIRHLLHADIEISYWKVYLGASFNYFSTPERNPGLFKSVAIFIFHDGDAMEKYQAKHGKGDFEMDMRAGIKVSEHFTMGFIIKNVTNTFYSLRPGKPEPLRNFTFQFRYNF